MSNCNNENNILDEIYEAKNINELDRGIKNICEHYMIEKFSIASISINKTVASTFAVLDDYPKEWKELYLRKQYFLVDPVFQNLQQRNTFFSWNVEKFKGITPHQKAMLLEAHDFNIKSGTTLPLLPNGAFQGFITLLNANIDSGRIIYTISNAANHYVREKRKLEINMAVKKLTKRQQDILHLKSSGYGIKRMADMLEIGIPAINFHLKKIKEKLDASSTDQVMYNYGFFEGHNH